MCRQLFCTDARSLVCYLFLPLLSFSLTLFLLPLRFSPSLLPAFLSVSVVQALKAGLSLSHLIHCGAYWLPRNFILEASGASCPHSSVRQQESMTVLPCPHSFTRSALFLRLRLFLILHHFDTFISFESCFTFPLFQLNFPSLLLFPPPVVLTDKGVSRVLGKRKK